MFVVVTTHRVLRRLLATRAPAVASVVRPAAAAGAAQRSLDCGLAAARPGLGAALTGGAGSSGGERGSLSGHDHAVGDLDDGGAVLGSSRGRHRRLDAQA